jgi:general secretion pathway protein J
MKRRRGFTLLELLLAVAMIATLGLALYASMMIGFRARRSAHAQVAAMREASIVMEIAQQDLQSVLPPRGTLAGPFIGNPTSSTTGSASEGSLDFYTLGRDAVSPADAEKEAPFSEGPRHVQLLLQSGEAGRGVLVRRVTRNLLATAATEAHEEVLARNVSAFTVRFFDGETWQTEWDSTLLADTLPVAVEMTIELADRDGGPEAKPYRATQIVPLACGVPLAETEMGGLP